MGQVVFWALAKTRILNGKTVSNSFLVSQGVAILFFTTAPVPGLPFPALPGHVQAVLAPVSDLIPANNVTYYGTFSLLGRSR